MSKLKLDTSDPHTRAVWESVLEARREVASWPAWKRGEQEKPVVRLRVIRTSDNGSLRLDGGRMLATLRVAIDRSRRPTSLDTEHWWVRDVELTPKAARALRDQLDAWLAGRGHG